MKGLFIDLDLRHRIEKTITMLLLHFILWKALTIATNISVDIITGFILLLASPVFFRSTLMYVKKKDISEDENDNDNNDKENL